MPSDKQRMYVALYARGGAAKMPGGEDKFHWPILIGPKSEDKGTKGVRYHAKEQLSAAGFNWTYEEIPVYMLPTNKILVRVVIGKIEDEARAAGILRSIPVKNGEPGWNCVSWAAEAFSRLNADKHTMGTSVLDWKRVRDCALSYCQAKIDSGRFSDPAKFNAEKVATYSLIEQKETTA